MIEQAIKLSGKYKVFIDLSAILLVLSVVGFYSFDFFHSIAEVFSAMVAIGIFMVAWNSRRYISNFYFLFIGVAYLFISFFILLHTLTFGQSGIFKYIGKDLTDQLWVASVYLTSTSFFIGPFFTRRKVNARVVFSIYGVVFALILLSIFEWRNFPALYVGSSWDSSFAMTSRIVTGFLFLSAIFMLRRKKKDFDHRVLLLLYSSLISLLASSQLIFARHSDAFNDYDLIGHLLEVVSSYFFYLGIVEIGLMKPYRILFKELKDREVTERQSEELYRTMIETYPDAVIIHDSKGILYANKAASLLFGAGEAKNLRRKKLRDFIHPDHTKILDFRMQEFEKGVKRFPMIESKIINTSGRSIEVEITGRTINYFGKPALQTTIRNMRHRTIAIHDAPDHIVMVNTSGQIIYANKAAQRLTGYVWEEMQGNTPRLWGSILLDEKGSVNGENGGKYVWGMINENNPSFQGEVRNTRKNGEKYIADLRISPIYDGHGGIAYYMGIARDITKIKELDRAKTEFLSLAAHELRTPLASISLAAELILRGVGGKIEEKQEKYLKDIYYSTHRMSELIHSFLNVSRIELGTFAVDSALIDIVGEVDSLVNFMRPNIEEKKIEFSSRYDAGLPYTFFDRNVLKIAIGNLISNAIRYTPQGGKISVVIKKNGNDIIVKVSDSGCGIPSEQQGKIFTKSFRADNARTANTEGLGLGLYISKSIVEKAGASISFDSQIGKGTNFYISIPVKTRK